MPAFWRSPEPAYNTLYAAREYPLKTTLYAACEYPLKTTLYATREYPVKTELYAACDCDDIIYAVDIIHVVDG